MPRTTANWLALCVPAAALLAAGWPGPAGDPATEIGRVDAALVAAMMAGLPWLVRRWFGPVGARWPHRLGRAAGYTAVAVLLAVKDQAQRQELARPGARPQLSGLWAGELAFVAVIGAYLAGLLAVTAARGPARRATLAIGGGAGILVGVAVYGLRPLAGKLPVTTGWVGACYEVTRVVAVPAVLAGVVAAAVSAARRAKRQRGSQLQLTDVRARQGLAAGACTGVIAATVVTVLGAATIAVLPQVARGVQWTLPSRPLAAGSPYAFESGFTQAGAGYLLVLIIFPLVGAGLGAWGGLFAGDTGLRPDGGGGGGPHRRGPRPAPPGGGLKDPGPSVPARKVDLATLLSLPDWQPGAAPPAPATKPVTAPEREPARAP